MYKIRRSSSFDVQMIQHSTNYYKEPRAERMTRQRNKETTLNQDISGRQQQSFTCTIILFTTMTNKKKKSLKRNCSLEGMRIGDELDLFILLVARNHLFLSPFLSSDSLFLSRSSFFRL